MQRCLFLAGLGAGKVAPNPMVGAVLVHAGRVIGEGYHEYHGGPHAEVNCLQSVPEADREFIPSSTLYVSLEPCAHVGKTPPCADLIIANKIPEVVIGCRDSFKQVDGKGIEKLEAAGVRVQVGLLEQACRDQNKRFFIFHEQHRPYIILKWAQSGDGKIASMSGERTYISGELSNRLVHRWRTEEQAILVGYKTALKDDPALTARQWPGNNPLRMVIDPHLTLPGHLKLFDGAVKTIVFNLTRESQEGNLIYRKIESVENIPAQIIPLLMQMHIQSIIIEGGAVLLRSFIDAGLWDEARVITNNRMLIGEGISAPVLNRKKIVYTQQLQNDTLVYFSNIEHHT